MRRKRTPNIGSLDGNRGYVNDPVGQALRTSPNISGNFGVSGTNLATRVSSSEPKEPVPFQRHALGVRELTATRQPTVSGVDCTRLADRRLSAPPYKDACEVTRATRRIQSQRRIEGGTCKKSSPSDGAPQDTLQRSMRHEPI